MDKISTEKIKKILLITNLVHYFSIIVKLRNITYVINRFFLCVVVENLIFGKNQLKKVSEVSRFSGYSGFAGSPVFRKFFFVFFKNNDVLRLFWLILFCHIKLSYPKKSWFISTISSFFGKFLVKKLFSEKLLSEILITF